jgi:cytochrome P450
MATNPVSPGCPVHTGRDDRKSAELAKTKFRPFRGSRVSRSFAFSRDILRLPVMRQAGGGSASIVIDNPDHVTFFFLDGEIHKKRRAAVASYFAPKAIVTRYQPIMQETMDMLVGKLRASGTGKLDEMSFEMASNVTMAIVGLTEQKDNVALGLRIKNILDKSTIWDRGPIGKLFHETLFGWVHKAVIAWHTLRLHAVAIKPAVEARRREPRDDVVSYMVQQGYSKPNMIIECLTYASAGVTTTRELMGMVAWHFFDNPELKESFLKAEQEDQIAILEEILRVDPVSGFLYRRPVEDVTDTSGGPIAEGELMAVSIRDSNIDETTVGECPFQIDPGRAKRQKVVGAYMSFGDGPHRCPGSQVALHETRIFIDRLFRVPGLRLVSGPKMSWNAANQGYELRDMVIACDPA